MHVNAPVAQWIRRLPTEQEIHGSIPCGGRFNFVLSRFLNRLPVRLVSPSPLASIHLNANHLSFFYSRFMGGMREHWHGILFEEPNPNREPPMMPNWALEDDDTGNPPI